MLLSRLDVALQQSLDRLLCMTSPTAPPSLACPIHPAQYNDWRLFKGDAYAVPPMPDALQGVIREIVALLDTRADMSLVRDPRTDEIIRDTLNDMLNRGPPMPSVAGGFDVPSASVGVSGGAGLMAGAAGAGSSPYGQQQYGGSLSGLGSAGGAPRRTPSGLGGGQGSGNATGAGSADASGASGAAGGDASNGQAGNSAAECATGPDAAINPVEASIHLCDAIYDIQYSDAATRHTRLCRHLIQIITLSSHEQHIRFAACVYRKILKSVAMAQKASQLKRRAHVGQGRLAQMNEASQQSQLLHSLKAPQHTAATGMELAKLNIVNVWEDLARDIKELCENTLRQHSGARPGHHHGPAAASVVGAGSASPSGASPQGGAKGVSAVNAITTLNMNSSITSIHQRAPTQALGLLMIVQATFPFLPTNCSIFNPQHSFRATILAVVSVLAGSAEGYVRIAAADCLGIVLTRHIRPADVQAETNQLFEMLLRNLRQGNCPENVAVGVCVTMKALLSIRGPSVTTTAANRSAAVAAAAAAAAQLNSPLSPAGQHQLGGVVPASGASAANVNVVAGTGLPTTASTASTPTNAAANANGNNTNNNPNAGGTTKASFDHNLVTGFCATAVELHRNTRQPSVKVALAALFPFLARVDPHFEARRQTYADAVIEPLKNIRETERKAQELYNFFAFLQAMGSEYDALKNETRVSFEAVLLRLLTTSVSPDQTGDTLPDTPAAAQQLMLPTACWYVIGAIFKNKTATNLHALVQRDCLHLLQHTVLTPGMLEAIKLVREGTAPFVAAFDDAVHQRARHVLVRTAQLINALYAPSSSRSQQHTQSPQQQQQQQQQYADPNQQQQQPDKSPAGRSPTSKGTLFSSWFGGNSGSQQQQGQSPSPSATSSRTASGITGQHSPSAAGSPNNNSYHQQHQQHGHNHQACALHKPSHIDEVMAAMDIFAKQQHFVSFHARNGGAGDAPDVVAYTYWKEMSAVMLPLLAHPAALVRAQCGRLLGHLFRMTITRAYPAFAPAGSAARAGAGGGGGNKAGGSLATSPHIAPLNPLHPLAPTGSQQVSPIIAPAGGAPATSGGGGGNKIYMNGAPITLYARAGMVPFLTAFARRVVFEVDTRVKVALLHAISGGTSGMLIPGQGQFPTVHSELVPQDVIECFASLISHVRRVREASLEVLLGVGGTTGVPSDRAHRALRKTVAMHIKAVGHLQDPHQIAGSCSTLTLLFEHRPSLLSVEILSTLMHASCDKIRQLYGNRLLLASSSSSYGGGGAGDGISGRASVAGTPTDMRGGFGRASSPSGPSGGGAAGGNNLQLQGLGIYDSQARHRAMLSVQEGEELGPHTGYATAQGTYNNNNSNGGGSGNASTSALLLGGDGGGGKAGAGGASASAAGPSAATLNAVALESAQTIVLLELINQLLIAGKMIQRQRLAISAAAAVTPTMAAMTESPTTRGGGKGFPTTNTATGARGGGLPTTPPMPLPPSPAIVAASGCSPSPVSALTESPDTRSILQTLWSCLLHSSRTIALVTSVSAASGGAAGGNSGGSNVPTSGGGLSSGGSPSFFHHGRTSSGSHAAALGMGGRAGSNALGLVGTQGSGGDASSSTAPANGSGAPISMEAQLVQIANAITIQHQALYALTDLLTLAPQNIIDFAHKTALIEYLRSEYLRCCGPQGQPSFSVSSHHQRGAAFGGGRDGIGGSGGTNSASNALLAIASASKNERHRRTIIRLFALMGAIDPAKGGFGRNTSSDAASIVVEGATTNAQNGLGAGGGLANASGAMGFDGQSASNKHRTNNNTNNYNGPFGGGGGGGNANAKNNNANNNNGAYTTDFEASDAVPKTSARSRDMILRNVQDMRRETYQFCGDANYPLTVYRMLARLLAAPEGVSDAALDAALKVSLQLITDPANDKILGWDLLEAMMDLVRPASGVSHHIRLQALGLLPTMIRHRSAVAGQLVREFFATALSCWDPSNEQTFLPLLTIIEELHVVNLKASENFSSCITMSSIGGGGGGQNGNGTNLPFALGAANEVDEVSGGASLYLRLVDVAMADRSATRDVSHKIIAIIRHIQSQALIAPVIVNSFVDFMSTNGDLPLDLRVELLRTLLILTYRFGILNCITPIVGLVARLLDEIAEVQHVLLAHSQIQSQNQMQMQQRHHHHHGHHHGHAQPATAALLPPLPPQLSIVALRDLSASIELILGKRPLTAANDHAAQQDRFATAGSSVHTKAIEVHRRCRKVLQRAAILYAHNNGIPCYEGGWMSVSAGNGQERTIHVLDYVLGLLASGQANNNGTASSSSASNAGGGGRMPTSGSTTRLDAMGGAAPPTNSATSNIAASPWSGGGGSSTASPSPGGASAATTTDGNPLDVIVLHINKAYNGMRRGASFEWPQWFVSFQQHVLLHCPSVALRICYDLFNLHEPLRKTLFFPAFHCLLVTVLRTAAAANNNSGPTTGGSPQQQSQSPASPTGTTASSVMTTTTTVEDAQTQMQRSLAQAIGHPLRRVLTALLRYGDTESVDMCLGLHDYLEHFRNPNAADTANPSNALGAMFTAATPHRGEGDDDDGTFTRGGCTLPNIQSQRQLATKKIRRTAQAHSHNAASLPSEFDAPEASNANAGVGSLGVGGAMSIPLLSDARRGGGGLNSSGVFGSSLKPKPSAASPTTNTSPTSATVPKFPSAKPEPPSANHLPWSLFRPEDLIRAALEHRLHYKAVRYLESDYPTAIKEGSRNPRTQPGRGISNGPLKSIAAIPAIRGMPHVNGKAAIGRANRLPATSANAIGVVNSLALQYSQVNMQSSVEGLFNSVHIGVDATGYELLQWWPEANFVYKRRIQQYERDVKEWEAIKAAAKPGSAGLTSPAPPPASGSPSAGEGVSDATHAFFSNAQTPVVSPSTAAAIEDVPDISVGNSPAAGAAAANANNISSSNLPHPNPTGGAIVGRFMDSGANSRHESPFLSSLPEPRSMSPFSPLTPTKGGDFYPLAGIANSSTTNGGNASTSANGGPANNSAFFNQHALLSSSSGVFMPLGAVPVGATTAPRPPMTSAPTLRTKDIEGYLRTLCFCGAWDEGLAFARDKFALLQEAAARSQDAATTPLAASARRGGGGGSVHRPGSASATAARHDETKKATLSRISVSDSAVMCASLCAVIMNQWEDVKQFSDLIIDQTSRLLLTQIYLARSEIKLFGASSQQSSPFGSFVGGGPMLPDLDQVPPSAPAPALLLDIENNLARAIISVDKELRTAMPMGYTHAYDTIAKLQHFQEIEEARLYRRKDSSAALQNNIKHMWFQRFQCMRPDAVSMLTSIVIYSLAAAPHDIPEAVYHFSKAVRRTHPQLGTWAMSSLQADALQPNTRVDRCDSYGGGGGNGGRNGSRPSTPLVNPIALVSPQQRGDVQVDYCEYLWSTGGAAQRERAIDGLLAFLASPDAIDTTTVSLPSHLVHQTGLQHVGRAHLLLGQWRQETAADRFWKREHREAILHHLSEAIQMVPQEYATWHNWALMNYRVQQRDVHLKPEERRIYVERAHRGFVAAICRSDRPKVVIQDIMRLLQLWIIYGGVEVLGEAVVDGIHRISSSLWATCTPQVVAHLGNEHAPIWAVVRAVLEKTLFSFPQLCVFQLLVPILSDPAGVGSRLRPSRARMLLNIACPEALTAEARAVAEGLVQLAMFPLEFIRDRIGQGLKILRSVEPPVSSVEVEAIRIPVHQALVVSQEKADALTQVGPVYQVITELLRLLSVGTDADFLAARAYCERLYNELQDHVKELKSISLQQCVCPRLDLARLRNLSIWVPGEYTPQRVAAPTIYGFVDRVEVLESKRRPRRMHIVGSDGNINTYCLKGNEDVRVDARAMQLFWLVNSFAAQNSADLHPISRFPVIPLTEDCGLLGWVHESETLYNTIRNFRVRAGVTNDPEMGVVNAEFVSPSHISRMSQLTIPQRADLFEHLFNTVESKDMAHVLWYRSVNAELWLKRRTRFTTSLATMSTAGYILGLGDRHPGNLLLQMATGAVVHIDFGDCFDVARYRSSFPETVPFRLTPMLVNAMEVFGVSGAFQATCEASMSSMRTNRDSIVALLSAFVYDPVMDKRITQHHGGNVQGIIDQVRRKLRGMEMPAYYYRQNAQSTSWKQPAMSEASSSSRAVATLKAQLNAVAASASSPVRRAPDEPFPSNSTATTAAGGLNSSTANGSAATVAYGVGANNVAVVTANNAADTVANLFPVTAAGGVVSQHFLASAHHMPQHTLDADPDEVMHAVLAAAGGDAAATLALDRALNNDNDDENEEDGKAAPTKREAAVRGEEHITWALQPRPDLPFVLSQAGSERAMKIAGVPRESLTVKDQVRILINESAKCENLSSLFAGWTAWW